MKRRAAREEAQQWSKQLESDEEEKERKAAKKAKGRSRVEDVVSGDEGEPRKKRRGKARKDGAEDDAGALFSEDEDTRPAPKKVCYSVFARLSQYHTNNVSDIAPQEACGPG